jgi:hypothetical protein
VFLLVKKEQFRVFNYIFLIWDQRWPDKRPKLITDVSTIVLDRHLDTYQQQNNNDNNNNKNDNNKNNKNNTNNNNLYLGVWVGCCGFTGVNLFGFDGQHFRVLTAAAARNKKQKVEIGEK